MQLFYFIRNVVLTFLMYAFHTCAYSQNLQPASIQHINEESGLSDNNVQCIYNDARNFMWVGTKSGLNLIDGSTITVFKNDRNNASSISNNNINCITSDVDGLLWIGTANGVNIFDLQKRTFKRIFLKNESAEINNNISSIAIWNKKAYIASSSGLAVYDMATSQLKAVPIPGKQEDKLHNNRITHIEFDKKGTLWLSTYNGVWNFNTVTHTFSHAINAQNDPNFPTIFTTFLIDDAGVIWAGTWNGGLKRFDPSTKDLKTFALQEITITSLAELKIKEGSKYILINDKLRYFDPKSEKIVYQYQTAEKKIPSQVLYCTGRKDEPYTEEVWIGGNKGLFFFSPKQNLVKHFVFDSSITSQEVALMEWKNNVLVGASDQNFLKLYSKDLSLVKDFSSLRNVPYMSCLSIQVSGQNTVKCGTTGGIADINLPERKIRFSQIVDARTSNYSYRFITYLMRDSDNMWWIFPWREGIWITDSATRNPRQVFKNFISEYHLPKPLVIACGVEDSNGNFWFGDYDEGVIFYDHKEKQFSKPFAKYIGARALISQIILYKDSCFSFLSNSVLTWNVNNKKLLQIPLPVEMDKSINDIALDSLGNLWMATQKGLVVYNLQKRTFRNFTTADGLLSDAMNGNLYCCSDGTMIYGCPDFLSSFRPEELLQTIEHHPGIQLVEVLADNKPIPFDLLKREEFDHNTHNFIFKWAVTDYGSPLNNHYYYKLEGIDREWRLAGKEGVVEFANLSPGDYTLLLKGESSNGVAADRILKLGFIIHLPFYFTWWFLSLIVLLAAALFYAILKYRINQIKKIEILRNNISTNLHDDIGSTLSSISILSDMALHGKKDLETKSMLSEIKENSMAMMERMDDIVWSINPKKDSLQDLFVRIKTFAARLFEAKEINYKIEICEEAGIAHVGMTYRQHIYLIMKEAINNMVKYSGCFEALIKINLHNAELTIKISDNGKGFDTSMVALGNGLINMKKRATEIGATIDITSAPGSGTCILLKTKIK